MTMSKSKQYRFYSCREQADIHKSMHQQCGTDLNHTWDDFIATIKT